MCAGGCQTCPEGDGDCAHSRDPFEHIGRRSALAIVRVFTTDQEETSSAVPLGFEAEIVELDDLSQPPEKGYSAALIWPPGDIKGWPPDWSTAGALGSTIALLRSEVPMSHLALGVLDVDVLASPEVAEIVDIATSSGADVDIVVKPSDD
jgi:hypothetical protein